MIALITNTDLTEVLVKLCNMLEEKPEFSASGNMPPTAQLAAIQTVLTELAPNDEGIQELSNCLELTSLTWAPVVQTSALWEQCSGPEVFQNVDFSAIRRTIGYLTTDPTHASCSIGIVFDEGCEVCTITRSALQQHFAAWKLGHSPFSSISKIGPPRALCLQQTKMNLHGFHGSSAGHSFMVLLHLRIAHAAYPVRCVLVDNAQGDIVLGLPFRRRYEASL